MNDINWREWPQLEFDIEQFDDVQDWVVNRFTENNQDVILVDKDHYRFHIAVRDSKILNYALLKFNNAKITPNQVNKEIIADEIKKQTELEIKRLIEELKGKLTDVPTFEQVRDAAKEDTFFSYDNGVWTNVKE